MKSQIKTENSFSLAQREREREMKTRKRSSSAAAAAKSKAGIQVSPISLAADTPIISGISPKKFDFNLTGFKTTSSSKKKTLVPTATLVSPINRSPTLRTPSTISDLKDHVSSRSDSIKRNLDLSHSEILKEFEAYHSRLSKRFKIHTQTCQQVMDEAEKEHKKMSDRISESVEAMKGSYAEFIKESQNSAARVCKSAIPELMQSMEKSVESLRKRYGIPATAK